MKRGKLYEVETILDKRTVRGKTEYLIKWKGYSTGESTWEPLANLRNIKEIIQKYELKFGKKKKEKTKVITLDDDSKENKNIQNQFIGKKTNRPKKEVIINLEEKEEKDNSIENNSTLYKIDESLNKVLAVKKDENNLVAIVRKLHKNGEVTKELIITDKLKKLNPWILIEYYESKIKFGN